MAVQKRSLIGFDFGSDSFKAVQLERIKNQYTLVAADIFPPVDITNPSVSLPELPEIFNASYAALCLSHDQSAIRILTLPDIGDSTAQIREQFGPGTDFRFTQLPISPPGTKPSRILAAALPEKVIEAGLSLFQSGPPALCNLEISGASTIAAALFTLGEEAAQGPLCFLDVGARATFVFFMNRGDPVLIRKYDVGSARFLEKVQAELHVDQATAIGVLHEGAVDLTKIFHGAMDSVVRQIVISRDFVERNEKCRIGKIFCSGALSTSLFWRQMLRDMAAMDVEQWNPLDRIAVRPGGFPAVLQGMETRFSGALGVALNVMGSL